MGEICLECLNKQNNTKDKEWKYILDDELNLCEECGEYKPTIICYRYAYYMRKFRYIIFPFRFLFGIIRLPYTLYLIKKSKE